MVKYFINAVDTATQDHYHGHGKIMKGTVEEAIDFAEMLAVRANSDGNYDVVINVHPISFWGDPLRSVKTIFSDPDLNVIYMDLEASSVDSGLTSDQLMEVA